MNKSFLINLLFTCLFISFNSFSQYLPDDFLNKIKNSNETVLISLSNNSYVERFIKSKGYKIESTTKNWIYLRFQGRSYYDLLNSEIARYVYSDFSEPILLNDSSRVIHKVNEVHSGLSLPSNYLGRNVIMGIIDSGVDFLHDDFKDSLGNTRIYRYWDQSDKTAITSPKPYNYGMVWTKQDIEKGKCTAVDNSGHGTNVTGIAAGNGRANGRNKGMAPEATIIMVETNLSATNWTLTVADACDYIFKVADSLGLPAVINISNGVQFGSHDGSDPASERIEKLLDEKSGRILVASAGNSGNSGKYHIHVDVNQDTSFYWVKPAVNGIAGVNTIYVDMWSDSIDFSKVLISSGANLNSGTHALRGTTPFRNFNQIFSKAPGAYRDTLYGLLGNKLAYVDYYASMVNQVARIQWVVTSIDSTNYFFQFRTTGSGSFDGWSGELNKLSNGKTYTDFVTTNLPPVSIIPNMKNYVLADTLQTIFSSYISSEKVITVGNISNRYSYKAKDGNTYFSNFPVGKLFTSSSKGPNRKKVLKPDLVASGNYTISSAPLYMLNDPNSYYKIDEAGKHSVNGGTSMSSPVIAGIAALYLEKCSKASYQDFKNDLIQTVSSNKFTGNLPNYAYGNGIANAFELLKSTNNKFSNIGDSVVNCSLYANTQLKGKNNISSITWFDLTNEISKTFSKPGTYNFKSNDVKNCISRDSIKIGIDTTLPKITIFNKDSKTITCFGDPIKLTVSGAYKYSWSGGLYLDRDSNFISVPGKYKVIGESSNGCSSSDSIEISKDPTPIVSIQNNSNSQYITCKQKQINLNALGAYTYVWNRGNNSFGASNQIIDSGMVVVTGKDQKGCIGKDSLLIIVDTLKPSLLLKYIGSKTISCNNDPVVIQVSGAAFYEWNGGINLNGSKNSFSTPGKYKIKATNVNGCSAEDSVIILKADYPKIPTIELTDSTLISSKSLNYQWYKDGLELKNDTTQTLKIYENGVYMVAVNLNGCISTSNYLKTNLNILDIYRSEIIIYPNPIVSNQFEIKNLTNEMKIKINDISGKLIDFERIDKNVFELKNVENGIYIISIFDDKSISSFKILKN